MRRREKANTDRHRAGRKWIFRTVMTLVIAAGFTIWQWPEVLWGYKRAPSFTLQASTGRPVSLEDFRGKKEVVLIFYMGAG